MCEISGKNVMRLHVIWRSGSGKSRDDVSYLTNKEKEKMEMITPNSRGTVPSAVLTLKWT